MENILNFRTDYCAVQYHIEGLRLKALIISALRSIFTFFFFPFYQKII